ncbi:NAD-dependent epimerase/dehydratase [mine drainage metagenome]|uniref:NAD-dependent epimerase/dehydratase n=1 Tax=mine drainage metagenome TaxID=410659 RepID=T1A2K3_9ZZZZ
MRSQEKDKPTVDLVTGATSAIGRAVVKRLLKRGDEVRVLVKEQPSDIGAWKSMPTGVIPYVADLTLKNSTDKQVLEEATTGVDNIFHIAAAVYNYNNTYQTLIQVNVEGTENLLNAVVKSNDDNKELQFIFVSSISIYGHHRKGEILTEESDAKPETPYAKSKYVAEQVVRSVSFAHRNLQHTILRLGTLYGPGYEKPSFCKIFGLIKKGNFRYVGRGDNHMTLIYIEDAADALVLASESKNALNKIYNLTDGEPHTQQSLVKLAANHLNVEMPSRHISSLLAKLGRRAKNINIDEYDFIVSDRIISIDSIKKDLKFSPKAKMNIEGVKMIDSCF